MPLVDMPNWSRGGFIPRDRLESATTLEQRYLTMSQALWGDPNLVLRPEIRREQRPTSLPDFLGAGIARNDVMLRQQDDGTLWILRGIRVVARISDKVVVIKGTVTEGEMGLFAGVAERLGKPLRRWEQITTNPSGERVYFYAPLANPDYQLEVKEASLIPEESNRGCIWPDAVACGCDDCLLEAEPDRRPPKQRRATVPRLWG
jgi:hypothetical protein